MRRKHLSRLLVCAACGIASTVTITQVLGQSFNVDFDSVGGSATLGGGVPSNAFGGAANQPGTWNSYGATAGPVSLVGLGGGATSATLALTSTTTTMSINGFNNPNNSGDYRLLMNDTTQIGTTSQGGSRTFTFAGLLDGPYALWSYGSPSNGNPGELLINVPGSNEGQLMTAGPMPANTFTLGVTHVVHTFNVVGGSFSVIYTDNAGSPSAHVNGMQLVPVPEPSSLAAVAMTGAALLVRRKRQ